MRTDWAGSSMDIRPFQPAYEPTVGATARGLRASSGRQPIDPVKVARVLLDVATLDEPPLHLVLGRDAVDYIARTMRETMASDARWADVGRSVDYDFD